MIEIKLTQGIHFDSYERIDSHLTALYNVDTSLSLKKGDEVEIDFDGDNATFWSGEVQKIGKHDIAIWIY